MIFKKPVLLYAYDALEPYIDKETMDLHYNKHHTAYVNGLSKLSGSVPSDASLPELLSGLFKNNGIKEADKEVLAMFGGGHYNHTLFWQYMAPGSSESGMSSLLKERIKVDFQTLEDFKKEFSTKAMGVFGSGWCWWVFSTDENKSRIVTTKDQANPIMENEKDVCLLGLDVWEHAYYVKYKNERARYVDSWWSVVNWELVSQIHDQLAVNEKQISISQDGYISFE